MDHKVTFGGKPVTLVGNRCKVGEIAPVFTVTDAGLQPVSSDVFHGKVRIYSVFPSVDTPVCSLQNIRFNREASKLGDNVVVVSLSVDLPFAQKRFCAKGRSTEIATMVTSSPSAAASRLKRMFCSEQTGVSMEG